MAQNSDKCPLCIVLVCRKNATKDSPKFPAWQAVFPMGRNYMQKLIEVEDGEMYSELEY